LQGVRFIIRRVAARALAALSLAVMASSLGAQAPAAAPAADAAEAPPPLIPPSNFAGRSNFWDTTLSPDGTMLAFMRRDDAGVKMIIRKVDDKAVVRSFATDPSNNFEWYRWVTNDKLLISVSSTGDFFGTQARYTRLYLVELSTGTMSRLFGRTAVLEGDNVIHVAKDGSHILVAIQRSVYDYPSVMRHELVPDGKVTTVQLPKENVWNWVADEDGVVRMGTGWRNGKLAIYYRKTAADEMKLVARLKQGDEDDGYWDALQLISGSDEGYVLSEGESGRVGLRRFNFATRENVETIYEHPEWDIDTVTLRDGKPFAAYFTAERDEVHFFDAAAGDQYAKMRKALGDVEVWVVSRSEDGKRMLVFAGNEADPGVLYLYEPAIRSMKEIAQFRPELDFQALARPRPVRYTARDGTVIRGYLTLPRGRPAKNLPLILMPHGGPFGIRDKLSYNDEVQLLANRGYAVLQPNFRGSGGYGDAFFKLGEGQVGRGMQDDVDDAMDWAVKEGIAEPKRVCVVGGSYGGYAALWAVLRNPERYICAASWAGVTDWAKMLAYDRRYLTSSASKSWQARVQGDKTFDLDAVSPYRLAGQLSRPVLLAHGTKDVIVPFNQYTLFEKATRTAPVKPETLVIPEEGHSFSKAENEQKWYEALEAFLLKHNPPDPAPATAAGKVAAAQ
jgi:dipeptidyl aminopeptidase/acylaminoacyl peptidase